MAFCTALDVPDIDAGRIRAARSVDADWVEWRKGPVVIGSPQPSDARPFRDPFVFRDAAAWRMLASSACAATC